MTPPRLTPFADRGYGAVAPQFKGRSLCDLLVTIDANGKLLDPKVIRCERTVLEKPAIESLMNSRFLPATLLGKDVPVRATVHLEYDGFNQ
jgi:hypothetical protein